MTEDEQDRKMVNESQATNVTLVFSPCFLTFMGEESRALVNKTRVVDSWEKFSRHVLSRPDDHFYVYGFEAIQGDKYKVRYATWSGEE